MNAAGAVAVFDLGKTNSKLMVFAADGTVVAESRTAPSWHQHGAFRVLDDAALERWMRAELAAAVLAHGVEGVVVSGHGCTFALAGMSELTHPVLDYEQEPPADVAARIDPLVPPFAETFSPRLPLGFNFGRHILWVEDVAPEAVAQAEAILCYPQFWTWRLSGRAVGEISYLGCHSHVWAPLAEDYSSLVDARGWRAKMPALARAGTVVGTLDLPLADGSSRTVAVHNGVHDSNASLYFYRALGYRDFTMVSTGTWVIVMNPDCPLDALDETRDMLANVAVDGGGVATARFMGGREFDVISGGLKRSIDPALLAALVARGVFALPSFASGGPFPGAEGRIVGDIEGDDERAALALLYVVMMTDLTLDLTRSHGAIIVDGGLARIPAFTGLIAALRPDQAVLVGSNPNGSACGAAALAFEATGRSPFAETCRAVEPLTVAGLAAYRDQWRALAGHR